LQADFKIEPPGENNFVILQDPINIDRTGSDTLFEELRIWASNLILLVNLRIKQIDLRSRASSLNVDKVFMLLRVRGAILRERTRIYKKIQKPLCKSFEAK
jgi:hypothetical protein